MKARHATQIRKGILAAHDPELRQYVHLGSRLFREAARREAVRMEDMELTVRHATRQALLIAAAEINKDHHLRRFYA